jgi:hypothetical protein
MTQMYKEKLLIERQRRRAIFVTLEMKLGKKILL